MVCSSSSSLPEVVGDAALTVDPLDETALAAALARALQDDTLRLEMRARGLVRAAGFSWERTARETVAVYRLAAADQCGRGAALRRGSKTAMAGVGKSNADSARL